MDTITYLKYSVNQYLNTKKQLKVNPKQVSNLKKELMETMEYLSAVQSQRSDYNSTDDFLGKVIGGYKKKEVTLIAGLPKSGRTVLLINCLKQHNTNLFPSLFFSTRLSNRELGIMFICSGFKLDISKLLSRKLDKSEVDIFDSDKIKFLSKYDNIYINDTVPLSLNYIKKQLKHLKTIGFLDLMIIDDIGLTCFNETNFLNNKSRFKKIIKSLSILAKEDDIHIILNMRLENRLVEINKEPDLNNDAFEKVRLIEKYVNNIVIVNRGKKSINDKTKTGDGEFIELIPYKTSLEKKIIKRYQYLSRFGLIVEK